MAGKPLKEYLTLNEAARRLNMGCKTLAGFLRANPQNPPLFAKPGRDYLISENDFVRIYETMKSTPKKAPALQPFKAPPSERQVFEQLQKLTTPKAKKGKRSRNYS